LRTASSNRLIAGVAMIVCVVLMQQLAQYITSRDAVRLRSVLLFFGLELPSLLWALSILFSWTRSHQLRWGSFVVFGLLLTAALGSIWGGAFYYAMLAWPELGLRAYSYQPASLGRIVLYGVTQAQTHFGLWTLAFALPAMLEDERVRALQSEKLAAESQQLRTAAELARLRGHLEPHFLLNTLNAIAGLVTEDPREARRLLAALGDLLRDALRDENETQPLAAQIAWLRRYAQILEARHRGDLSFSWEIPTDTERECLPRLLLQPLVENAVKHGALRAETGGRVWISTQLTEGGSRLLCTVRDNGPGLPPGPVRDGAFGLESVRRRVELRYGSHGRVTLANSAAGMIVTVEVPATSSRVAVVEAAVLESA
jgi:signal transduction histidine kinase